MVLELRQYTLHAGKRDVLIDLFDREFIESQEALGAQILGQFRDRDDPNRFVWLRAFSDMRTRLQILSAFYGGPVWKTHRQAANETMVDSDNVLLLRPIRPSGGFAVDGLTRPAPGAKAIPQSCFLAAIYSFPTPPRADFAQVFERELQPALAEHGFDVRAAFVTDPSPNNFPALPVREGEYVFAWFARLEVADEFDAGRAASLPKLFERAPEVLRLSPTARSLLR